MEAKAGTAVTQTEQKQQQQKKSSQVNKGINTKQKTPKQIPNSQHKPGGGKKTTVVNKKKKRHTLEG